MPSKLKVHLKTSLCFLLPQKPKTKQPSLKSQSSSPSSFDSSQPSGSNTSTSSTNPPITDTPATPHGSSSNLAAPVTPSKHKATEPSTPHTSNKLTKSRTPRTPSNKLDSRYSRERGCKCPDDRCTYEYRTRPPTDHKLWCWCCNQCKLLQLLMEDTYREEDAEAAETMEDEHGELGGIGREGTMVAEDKEVADWWSWTGGRDKAREKAKEKGKQKC